jgi:hypothetical protein
MSKIKTNQPPPESPGNTQTPASPGSIHLSDSRAPSPSTPQAEREGRKRTYAPRINNKKKDAFVSFKQAELRDARILYRLIAEARELTPWGLGIFKEAIDKLGPVQQSLVKQPSASGVRVGDGLPLLSRRQPEEEVNSGELLPARPATPSSSATLTTTLLNQAK